MSFSSRQLAGNEQMGRIFMFMKKIWPQWVVCPCPRAKYVYIIVKFKHVLLLNGLANQSQTSCGESVGSRN